MGRYLRIAEKLRHHRDKRKEILLYDISQEYGIGLKKLVEPDEVKCITAILKYISDLARMKECLRISVYEKSNFSIPKLLKEACIGLLLFFSIFGSTLEEPELLDVTTESVMDVMEIVLIWTKDLGVGGGAGLSTLN
ncbi:unnamed protein product [Meganyctiphanes norvegica]|uniref:Uncharacterized protein n=1 Tax=Meganyctiphanes norvegica TaxID=48144 RepID=A0AAV2QBB7_MEGNR